MCTDDTIAQYSRELGRDLSNRVVNRLPRDITRDWQLARMTEAKLLAIRNLGRGGVAEVKRYLESRGMSLGMVFDEGLLHALEARE